MNQSNWRLALTAALLTALLVTALAPAAFAAEQSAPASQVRATEVSGTVPGGQFAKLWLGLEIINPGNFTVTATWDRLNPEQNGVGFYILDPGNVAAVSMGERIERNQLAMGDSNFFVTADKNVQGASIRAAGTDYTIVVYNDSATDARFTLSVDNGIIVDNDNQVDAPAAATESTSATLGVLIKGAPDEISRLSSFKRRRISIYRPIDGIAGDSGEALKGVPKSLGEGPLRQATPLLSIQRQEPIIDDTLRQLTAIRQMLVEGLYLLLKIAHQAPAIRTHGIDPELEGIPPGIGSNAPQKAGELRLIDKGKGTPVKINAPAPSTESRWREGYRIRFHDPIADDHTAP